jgi:hypothetical protein
VSGFLRRNKKQAIVLAIWVALISFLSPIGDSALNNLFFCRQPLAICLQIYFISCRQSGEQGTPKIHFFSPVGGSISFFPANLAKFRHYFEH